MSEIRGHTADGAEDRAEIVVVGGGIAGLAAAWFLRDRDVRLLEASDRIGGRVMSERRDSYWVNLGAHVLDSPLGHLAETAKALGQSIVVPSGAVTSVAMRGRVIRANRPEVLPFLLPLSPAARISLVRVGLRLQRAYRAERRAEKRAALKPHEMFDQRIVDDALENMTYAELLGPMHPDVAALMRVTANRMASEPSRLSARVGVVNSMGVWSSKRANVVGGTEELTKALTAAIGGRVTTGARVRRITQDANGVSVTFDTKEGPRLIKASVCIVTVPAFEAAAIVDGLTAEKQDALRSIKYGPFVVAGLFTKETGVAPWDSTYAAAVPNAAFGMFFNPANPLRKGGRTPGGSLVIYAAGDPAAELLSASDSQVSERFLGDLHKVSPLARGTVSEVIIQRWPIGVPVSSPGRARLQSLVASPVGRIHFAGDYIVDPGVDSSFFTAHVSAQRVRAVVAGSASAPDN